MDEGANGFWAVETVKSGKYEIELYRWPRESHLRLNDTAPGGESYPPGKGLNIKSAKIRIGGQEFFNIVEGQDSCARFVLELQKGYYQLECRFKDDENIQRNAYYVYVKCLEK